jgi:beta-glucanase (GH16 family)
MLKRIYPYTILFFVLSCSSSPTEKTNETILPDTVISCTDGIRNGDELGIDYGGAACNDCPEIKAIIPSSCYDAPMSYEDYYLVWNDEFNEKALSDEKWNFHLANSCPNLYGWGNNELQYYTNKNHSFDEGNLIIQAKNETTNDFNYSSSRILTHNKFEFEYSRIDIRARMPSATGTWVTLWLLNKDYSISNSAAEWTSGGEIDIMEYLGRDEDAAFGTAQFGSDLNNHNFISGYYDAPSQDFDEAYYVFSIVWEEDSIKWLINNVEYHSFISGSTGGQHYPLNDDFYFVMNLSVGGNLPVAPVAYQYPAFVIIDYVRVFNQNS